MRASFEFLFGLLDCGETACVAQEDREGEHGPVLRLWQRMGFIDSEPGVNPVAGCPHCGEGVPYALGSRLLCPLCRSEVDPSCLLLWRVHLSAHLHWIAKQWHLRGGVRRLEDRLWQLGSLESAEGIFECFYRKAGDLSRPGKDRLLAYRQAIVLHGVPPIPPGWGSNLSIVAHVKNGVVRSGRRGTVRARCPRTPERCSFS